MTKVQNSKFKNYQISNAMKNIKCDFEADDIVFDISVTSIPCVWQLNHLNINVFSLLYIDSIIYEDHVTMIGNVPAV